MLRGSQGLGHVGGRMPPVLEAPSLALMMARRKRGLHSSSWSVGVVLLQAKGDVKCHSMRGLEVILFWSSSKT